MKKTIITIILMIFMFSLSGCVNQDNISVENNTLNENNYDTTLVDELIKKYVDDKAFYGTNIFTDGLKEEIKMLIAFKNFSTLDTNNSNDCSSIYDDSEYTSDAFEYEIKLDTSNTAFCSPYPIEINYNSINDMYKTLFKGEMPKKDIKVGNYAYDYKISKTNSNFASFYKLDVVNMPAVIKSFYGIKNFELKSNELIVNVGYIQFDIENQNSEIYVSDFDSTIKETFDNSYYDNYNQVKKNILEKYLDKTPTYKFVFEKVDNHYILSDVVKSQV